MALVHPELFLNIDQKVTALTFLDKKAGPTSIKILVGTSAGSAVQVWDLKSQKLEETLPIFEKGKNSSWNGMQEGGNKSFLSLKNIFYIRPATPPPALSTFEIVGVLPSLNRELSVGLGYSKLDSKIS